MREIHGHEGRRADFINMHNIQYSQTQMYAQKTSTTIEVVIFFFFLRMLGSVILAEIMQHAKLALHTEIISVCVLLDLDLKATIVIKVRNPLNFFVVSKMNVWPFLI